MQSCILPPLVRQILGSCDEFDEAFALTNTGSRCLRRVIRQIGMCLIQAHHAIIMGPWGFIVPKSSTLSGWFQLRGPPEKFCLAIMCMDEISVSLCDLQQPSSARGESISLHNTTISQEASHIPPHW